MPLNVYDILSDDQIEILCFSLRLARTLCPSYFRENTFVWQAFDPFDLKLATLRLKAMQRDGLLPPLAPLQGQGVRQPAPLVPFVGASRGVKPRRTPAAEA